MKIQSVVRCKRHKTAFNLHKYAASEIQRFARGQIVRSWLLGSHHIFSSLAFLFFDFFCQLEMLD